MSQTDVLHPAPTETVIRPAAELTRVEWREYLRYQHLFASLVWRNIRVRFQDMRLGFLWTCIRPLLYVAVFVAYQRLSAANTYVNVPYPLYIYSGLIVWQYLTESLTETTGALWRDAGLLTKVYYPRLISPAVPIVANLLGLAVSVVPLIFMMVWYGVAPTWRLVLLPLVLIQCMAFVLGVGTVFACLALVTRDWERLLGSLLYLGMFVSPVIYAAELIPAPVRWAYFLNPMAGTLLAFRSALFAAEPFPWLQWLYSSAFSAAAVALGIRLFRAAETDLADRL